MNGSKKLKSHPLMSWDISGAPYRNPKILEPKKMRDVRTLVEFSLKYGWFKNWVNELDTPYDALVLTNRYKEIQWVSEGFKNMTGYSPAHAVGKKPNFLQGPETSERDKNVIREKLRKGRPFSASLINYKKSGKPYTCAISILPLKNDQNETSHYLALEIEEL